MNRSFACGVLLAIISVPARAQNPAQTNAVRPDANSSQAPLIRINRDLSDTANENRLVEFALRGPEYDLTFHQNVIDELTLKKTKTTWLDLLSISTNYNDQTFAKTTNAAYVYPKYFFGITIPLGIIFSQGNAVKSARESVKLGKDQQEITARTIRANVLSRYANYKHFTMLIEMEGEIVNDVQANYSQAEDNFRRGAISVDSYILVQREKNEEITKVMNLQLQQDLARIDIERMIGAPLYQVLHPIPRALRK
jgi:Outer membrane efflux protein